ncbi:hypothetical protein BH10PSE12_BH10PSE12_13290 [soil metagenome]
MTEPSPLSVARHWVQALAAGDFDAWPDLADEALVMHVPFSPPGLFTECVGRDACIEMTRGFWAAMQSFAWHDIDIHASDDPGMIFGTARSEAMTVTGQAYTNRYCFIAKVRDGRVYDYTEYFNPLPVMEAFGAHLTPA